MSNNHATPLATVVDIIGQVWAIAEDGSRHLLKSGDAVYEGEVIVTDAAGMVVLLDAHGADLRVGEGKAVVLSHRLFVVSNNTLDLDPGVPAHQVNQGRGTGQRNPQVTHGYLRVGRIQESVTPPAYRLWSFIGNYDHEHGFRTSGYDPLLDGRATLDERIVMSFEPLVFSDVEPLPVQKTILFEGTTPLRLQNYIPLNNKAIVTGEVQEDALTTGNRDTTADTVLSSGSIAPLVSVGPNVPITFSLQFPGLDAPVLTSRGRAANAYIT